MRNHILAWAILGTAYTAPTITLAAADIDNGKALYMKNCMGCHDTGVHTRTDRIIFSKKALRKRVEFCDVQAGSSLSSQNLTDVTEWLNQEFYQFDD